MTTTAPAPLATAAAPSAPAVAPHKPGYRTTEFWLYVGAILASLLFASGALPAGSPAQAIAASIVSVFGALGYGVARSALKMGATSAASRAAGADVVSRMLADLPTAIRVLQTVANAMPSQLEMPDPAAPGPSPAAVAAERVAEATPPGSSRPTAPGLFLALLVPLGALSLGAGSAFGDEAPARGSGGASAATTRPTSPAPAPASALTSSSATAAAATAVTVAPARLEEVKQAVQLADGVLHQVQASLGIPQPAALPPAFYSTAAGKAVIWTSFALGCASTVVGIALGAAEVARPAPTTSSSTSAALGETPPLLRF